MPYRADCETDDLLIKVFKFIINRIFFSYNVWPFTPLINEDIFWGMVVPKMIPDFNVPSVSTALGFSF